MWMASPSRRLAGTRLQVGGVSLALALGPLSVAAQGDPIPAAARGPVTYTVVSSASLLQVHTRKAGLLGGLGHEHDVRAHGYSGTIVYDAGDPTRSLVSFTVPTDSLRLVIASDSSDIPAITKTMRERVLHVDRFPEIRFTGHAASVHDDTVHVQGNFTLVGVTRPVEVDLVLRVSPEILHVWGSFSVKQTDFGIRPYTTVLGTIKVGNEVTFTLDIRALVLRSPTDSIAASGPALYETASSMIRTHSVQLRMPRSGRGGPGIGARSSST